MKTSASALCFLLLAGCGGSGSSGGSGDDPAGQSQQLDNDHVLSTQTDALDKAGAVEKELLDAARLQREQIEDDAD
ncbi:MAG: hypothetical protein Tsb0027_05740 [Wenzhouxiangellaceae bacterium]